MIHPMRSPKSPRMFILGGLKEKLNRLKVKAIARERNSKPLISGVLRREGFTFFPLFCLGGRFRAMKNQILKYRVVQIPRIRQYQTKIIHLSLVPNFINHLSEKKPMANELVKPIR